MLWKYLLKILLLRQLELTPVDCNLNWKHVFFRRFHKKLFYPGPLCPTCCYISAGSSLFISKVVMTRGFQTKSMEFLLDSLYCKQDWLQFIHNNSCQWGSAYPRTCTSWNWFGPICLNPAPAISEFSVLENLVSVSADMRFVKKYTPLDFQAKNFAPLISPNINSLGYENEWKWRNLHRWHKN